MQRVRSASVAVDGETIGEIGPGLVVLVGFQVREVEGVVESTARRIANLRIFEDDDGRMNHSLLELGLSVLVVSQFTLYADTQKGRRPSFAQAMAPAQAEELYLRLVECFRSMNIGVATGQFGARMLLQINNWGPVTLILDA